MVTQKLNSSVCFVILMLGYAYHCDAQKFTPPAIPKHDSVFSDIGNKTFFLKQKKVFEIGYNTGSMLYVPFFAIGGAEEDSCYAYFNGADHESYDFYYFAKSYIVNEQFAENSKIFKHRKFTWDNKPIESGEYYFIREMYNKHMAHNQRYKIGKWLTYDSAGKQTLIDYDNFTLNGKPIKFQGSIAIIETLKNLATAKLIAIYGKDFCQKYVRFNLDRSGYYTSTEMRPEIPGGISLLTPSENEITFVDLSYDIVLGDERFNVIQFRVSKEGKFLGRTYIPGFVTSYFYLTQGLDSLNRGRFHPAVLNWKKIAREKGMDITSKNFNVRMEFTATSDTFGDLRLVLEQAYESTESASGFTNKLKQYKINPWTGEVTESQKEEAVESIMMEEGG